MKNLLVIAQKVVSHLGRCRAVHGNRRRRVHREVVGARHLEHVLHAARVHLEREERISLADCRQERCYKGEVNAKIEIGAKTPLWMEVHPCTSLGV